MTNLPKPLSERLTDTEIARLLREYGLGTTPSNIHLVRDSRRTVERYMEQLSKGRPAKDIFMELRVTNLERN